MRQKKRPKKIDTRMKKKLAGLFACILVALVGLTIRITVINAQSGDKYKKQVMTQSQQQYDSRVIPFRRGDISDRNGTILATSNKVYNVILDCYAVNAKGKDYTEPTVEALVSLLGIDEQTVRDRLTKEETKQSRYQVLKKQISMDEKKAFEAYTNVSAESDISKEERTKRNNVQGVWFEEAYLRTYPYNSLACDTIGFVYNGNEASWGIEGYYSSLLNGVNGRKYGYFNQDADLEQTIIDPINGNNVVSTLDVNVQQVIEKYLNAFDSALSDGPFGKKGAKNIGIIVANPSNGEILGMASSDPYDLNNPRDLSNLYTQEEIDAMDTEKNVEALNNMWRNYCISDAFEPGSTVKPLIIAGALETGAIMEMDTFACDGGQQVADAFIRCSVYPDAHGTQTLGEVIQHSCNDAMMQIAKKTGIEDFVRYHQIFNFGTKTGIDLPGEGTGIIYSTDTMNSVELATSSFGQGFTCTMIQEIGAICSVINGGTYYQPHVMKKIVDPKGRTIRNTEPIVLKEVVSTDVSADIREYMGRSVSKPTGTGRYAKVTGYSMGGKTGTAQKIPRGNDKYLVSFIGFAPLDNPQVAIYVVVDEPNVGMQSDSKYPQYIAQAILSEILPYLNIYPDEEEGVTQLWEGFSGVSPQAGIKNTEEATGDGIADTAVPAPPEEEEEETTQSGGNNLESDGITNEEAGISD